MVWAQENLVGLLAGSCGTGTHAVLIRTHHLITEEQSITMQPSGNNTNNKVEVRLSMLPGHFSLCCLLCQKY